MKLERALVSALNASGPEWLADRRERAYESYTKLEMPSSAEEVWRYLDLDFDLFAFEAAAGPPRPLQGPDPVGAALASVSVGSARVVDGAVVESSDVAQSLGSANRAERDRAEAAVQLGAIDVDLFAAAHNAFLRDVVVVRVPSGQVDRGPRYVDVQATSPRRVSFPHLSVSVEEDAETSVVAGLRSPDTDELLVIPAFDIDVGPGGRCSLTIVQGLGAEARSISRLRARLARDASLVVAEAGLGAKLSRLHLTVDLEGTGSEVQITGLYFGERDQTLDYRAFVNHLGRSTRSVMLLKGAVEDEARSVFTGLIKIEKGASRANAFQTNRNLVLSEGAQAQSVPNLEILCDEVMCGHASTSGPLDPEHLYYLRSRGLRKSRAERLLVRGFFEEVIRKLPEQDLAPLIRAEVNRKFVEAQQQGRL